MKLKDILIAFVAGGVFHNEDTFFQTDMGEFVKGVDSLLNKMKKAKKIKHDYLISLIQPDKDNAKSEQARIRLNNSKDKNVEIDIKVNAIVFGIGALLKQEFLRKGNYLWEVTNLIDEIYKFRKAREKQVIGIYPKFAIPFKKEVAVENLKNIMFPSILNDLGISDENKPISLTFKSITQGKITIESTLGTTDDHKSITAMFDFRAIDPTKVKSYSAFVSQVKPLYSAICKTFIQKLIQLKLIDEKLLTENKP
jgi:hypothetical protein